MGNSEHNPRRSVFESMFAEMICCKLWLNKIVQTHRDHVSVKEQHHLTKQSQKKTLHLSRYRPLHRHLSTVWSLARGTRSLFTNATTRGLSLLCRNNAQSGRMIPSVLTSQGKLAFIMKESDGLQHRQNV